MQMISSEHLIWVRTCRDLEGKSVLTLRYTKEALLFTREPEAESDGLLLARRVLAVDIHAT